MDEKRHDAAPPKSGPDMIAIEILERLDRYDRTSDGECLMMALYLYFQHYATRGGRDAVIEGVGEAFSRAWERWMGGRMDSWDPGSAPVRKLGQAFRVCDRDGRWKPKAETAWLAPVNEHGKRKSPGDEVRAIWTTGTRSRGRLTAKDIPVGMSVRLTAVWTVQELCRRDYVISNDPDDPKNAFVEAERLLGISGLGWSHIKDLYYEYPRPHSPEPEQEPPKKRTRRRDTSRTNLAARANRRRTVRKRRK